MYPWNIDLDSWDPPRISNYEYALWAIRAILFVWIWSRFEVDRGHFSMPHRIISTFEIRLAHLKYRGADWGGSAPPKRHKKMFHLHSKNLPTSDSSQKNALLDITHGLMKHRHKIFHLLPKNLPANESLKRTLDSTLLMCEEKSARHIPLASK